MLQERIKETRENGEGRRVSEEDIWENGEERKEKEEKEETRQKLRIPLPLAHKRSE